MCGFPSPAGIIAQIVGAVASVVLGVMVLQRYQAPSGSQAAADVAPAAAADAQASRAASPRRPGQAAIAVLPLDNLSGSPDQEYFVDGMTEAVVAGLAKVEGLKVISRTSTTRYKTEHPSIPEIARALGVDLVVEGSVLQAGDQVRITAQLIDGASDEHLWAESYTRTLKDVIALQDTVASAIATAIKGTVSQRPGAGVAPARHVDAATYDLYLRGRHAWFKRTPEAMRSALEYFEKAVAADPAFALAYVGIADTHAVQGSPGMPLDTIRERMDRARAAAMRALDLDPELAEAHTALAGVVFFGDRDLVDAEQKLRRAIALNPSYAVAHEWLAILLGERGRFDEALTHADIAVSLDPFEASMYQGRGQVQYAARRFDEAIASERRALELSPQMPLARTLLTKALVMAGRAPEALTGCDGLADTPGEVDLRIACVIAATRTGRPDRAAALRAPLEARRPEPGAALAQIDGALGQYASTWPRLSQLAQRGALSPIFATDPLYEGLRRQPEWARIVETDRANARVSSRPPAPTSGASVRP